MNFLLRLLGAFLASSACVSLVFVLGPAGLLLPAAVIVILAFSENRSPVKNGSIIYFNVVFYLSLLIALLAFILFDVVFESSERYEIIRSYLDYQIFRPVFADKSFFQPEGLSHSDNALYLNLAFLVSQISVFSLVFFGACRFGEVQKVVWRIDERFCSDGKISASILILMIFGIICVFIYYIYIDDFSPYRSSSKMTGFVALSCPIFLYMSVHIFTLFRRLFE